MPDADKILKDLEKKIVGVDPQTDKMNEGYFISFRNVGLPITSGDYENPWTPLGGNLNKAMTKTEAADPQTAPKTGSSKLDPNQIIAAGIAKSQQNYLNTFLLTDDKLQMNNQYTVMPNVSKVSDSWWAIITGANGIPTDSVLNDDMKAAYDAATAKLMDKDGNPTPHYQAYMQYQDAYNSKVRAWNRAYANAITDPMKLQNWPIDGTLYQDDADQAMSRWEGLGFKNEIEQALDTLAAQGIDPAIALIVRARNHFQNSLNEFKSIGEIPYTMMLPNTWYDKDNDDGWTDYGMTDFHAESHSQSSSTSYKGGGGFNLGFWKADGGFDSTDTHEAKEFSGRNLEVSLSYCAVDIKRPWLDTSLLNLKNWFLMGDYKKSCISDGTMQQQLPAKETEMEHVFLPSIVTTLVLIKDLKLRWNNWQEEWRASSTHNDGQTSIGWGPFAVHASYSNDNENSDFKADDQGEWLHVKGIQLLGYVSAIVPACPAVDSSQYLKKAEAAKTGAVA
jgi:hypothetical protein